MADKQSVNSCTEKINGEKNLNLEGEVKSVRRKARKQQFQVKIDDSELPLFNNHEATAPHLSTCENNLIVKPKIKPKINDNIPLKNKYNYLQNT